LDRDQWALLVSVDGRRSVASLARRLDLGLLRCCQLLKPVVEIGAISFAPEAERTAPNSLRIPPAAGPATLANPVGETETAGETDAEEVVSEGGAVEESAGEEPTPRYVTLLSGRRRPVSAPAG
jgi:hypothetical protein